MAAEIGVKVKIDGYAEFKKNINDLAQQQKTLKSDLAAVSSAWDKNTSAEKKNAETKKNLAQQIDVQKQKVEQLKSALEQVESKYGENSKEANSWKEKLNSATAELNRMEQALKDIPNSMQTLGKSMQETGDKIKGVGEAFAPISAAAAAGLGVSVKLAADFEQQMNKVGAISGASADDMVKLSDKAREMGATTKFSATEAGQAMEYMAMAGWKTDQMIGGIAGIMSLAAASGEDLATTSDIVTDALTAFGLSASDSAHFADVLAAASSNANTNVSMMGETFKYAAPIAGAMGYSIEDTAVAIGLMANSGIKASQAGTSLRTILSKLSGEITISGKNIGDVVIQTENADGSMRELSDILADCREAFAGLTESEKASAAEALVGKNAMTGFLALMGAGEGDVTKLTSAINNCDGAAQTMADRMNSGLNGQLTVLKSSLQEAGISIGNALAPAIGAIAEKIQEAVTWFNSLDDKTKSIVATIGVVVAAIGPVLVIIGTVVSAIGTIIAAIGAAVPVIAGVGTAFAGVVAAAAPFIAIAAAVVAAGVLIYKNWDTIKAKAQELATAAKQKFDEFKNAAVEKFNAAKEAISNAMTNAKATIDEKLSAIQSATQAKLAEVKAKWEENGGGIKGAVKTAMDEAKQLFEQAYDFINTLTGGKLGEIVSAAQTKLEELRTAFMDKINAAKQIVEDGVNFIKGLFDFEWSLPPLKLPHFHISGQFSLNPPSVPSFSVDWYAKAMENGMILTSPTIFGAAGGKLLGAGEAGPEVVVGASSLYDMIRGAVSSVNNYGGVAINIYPTAGQNAKEIAEEVSNILTSNLEMERAKWA